MNRILCLIGAMALCLPAAASDTIPSGFTRPLHWSVGAELTPAGVTGAKGFLKGDNDEGKHMKAALAGSVRADFKFDCSTREGMLYRGLYQGIGFGATTFFSNSLLGTPVSAYVYQGAPFVRFSDRLSLLYEWQFGAAFGWKHNDSESADNNAVVSTAVTAHMGLGVRLKYLLSERWAMTLGISATHFSNGNTSWPNGGVNYIGASVGLSYTFNPQKVNTSVHDSRVIEEADRGRWSYDLIAYGAWRKRVVSVGNPSEPQLCPGKFAIAGMQFAPLRSLNRYVAIGPSLDLQWDEGAGLSPYWVEGTYGERIKFRRPSVGKQIGMGLSAHAELTMPIFAINAGLGYDIINPQGERAFYQSLALKTFVTRNLYLNVGYRLGSFKDPQNLMLGVGFRIR